MATMERRKTLTMNWDALGDDDDDEHFFESHNRLSTAVPRNLIEDEEGADCFEESRLSIASNMSSMQSINPRVSNFTANFTGKPNYDIWMAAPGSITERRRQLLGSMGLDENKELLKATSAAIARAITKKFENNNAHNATVVNNNNYAVKSTIRVEKQKTTRQKTTKHRTCASQPVFVLVRSRSENDMDSYSMEKSRMHDFIGKVSKQRLTRTATEITRRRYTVADKARLMLKEGGADSNTGSRHVSTPSVAMGEVGAFLLIKNLDTGKEFIVKECGEDGNWNRLSDLQTGKQLTIEEFEKTVGHSEVVKEAMRRAKGRSNKKMLSNSISKSLKLSKRRGASLLKNIKGVASGIVGEREREAPSPATAVVEATTKNEWVKVRQTGKSQKELSALHMCQEFQAHEGCVWTLKFSLDGRYLASAGEDKMIHVWEVQECDVMSMKPDEGNLTSIPTETPPLSADKKKKGKNGSKRGGAIPDYVHVPETVFSLSERPFCSFNGHLDEVLDLSWSKSQLLLSSSMDKTVRLWDLESKSCLKFFAHNDYVTCVQFNPVDEDYFISGSLDAKIRMWNIPARLVVDWTDIHEMVTAVSYTPDGQGVIVGTQKGSCRSYTIEDFKLNQSNTIELRNKKKNLLKKVTGFQYSPGDPSQVLITSGDCRTRVVEATQVVQKFIGFRNASSQISASFSPNGKYIICASEDSQVYVWKHEEMHYSGKGRNVIANQAHEHFPCKDVSVAIPWPCNVKGDLPPSIAAQNQKKNSTPPAPAPAAANNKKNLPPLPKKSNNNQATENSPGSPEKDHAALSRTESGVGDSKRNAPPKKSNNHAMEGDSIEEELEAITRSENGSGDSLSASPSGRHGGDPASISAAATPSGSSWSSNYSSGDGSNGDWSTNPSAWGMVIVTAGFGGEIRCYQNFGLPRRMRQNTLFMGPTL
ncbi:WD repeat-containing protein YMR102C-like [Vigna unguiculata]|uniref:WD repeat-containing protein YMR102C-like n=2 Tax=Vigna unguiculata TaxID=3917 RepID=UPI00101645DF|nr:WD repeat-containing protein YMR102C-like [Vigna unguiculata]